MDISICMPGIRTHLWESMYASIENAVTPYTWELIMVGPYAPPDNMLALPNFKFLEDWGAPARCAQRGTTLASGELLTWGSDDGVFLPGSVAQAIQTWHALNDAKAIICMRYREKHGRTGDSQPLEYWRARYHDALRVPGVDESYLMAPVGLLQLAYFRDLGGWDCRYEHLNMCCHDLAFRAQRDGGQVQLSPSDVLNCDWNPGSGEHAPVYAAFLENDLPLFQQQYMAPRQDSVHIAYDNWQDAPARWQRRFGD